MVDLIRIREDIEDLWGPRPRFDYPKNILRSEKLRAPIGKVIFWDDLNAKLNILNKLVVGQNIHIEGYLRGSGRRLPIKTINRLKENGFYSSEGWRGYFLELEPIPHNTGLTVLAPIDTIVSINPMKMTLKKIYSDDYSSIFFLEDHVNCFLDSLKLKPPISHCGLIKLLREPFPSARESHLNGIISSATGQQAEFSGGTWVGYKDSARFSNRPTNVKRMNLLNDVIFRNPLMHLGEMGIVCLKDVPSYQRLRSEMVRNTSLVRTLSSMVHIESGSDVKSSDFFIQNIEDNLSDTDYTFHESELIGLQENIDVPVSFVAYNQIDKSVSEKDRISGNRLIFRRIGHFSDEGFSEENSQVFYGINHCMDHLTQIISFRKAFDTEDSIEKSINLENGNLTDLGLIMKGNIVTDNGYKEYGNLMRIIGTLEWKERTRDKIISRLKEFYREHSEIADRIFDEAASKNLIYAKDGVHYSRVEDDKLRLVDKA